MVSTDDCLLWARTVTPDGYGRIFFRENGKEIRTYAHRFIYELEVGAIPEGYVIDHLCRNRSCINTQHMEPVTNRENIRRGKGYALLNECPQGHPYSGENLLIERSTGFRRCLECRRAGFRKTNDRRKAKVS